jgi:hypothetical protein
LPSPLKVVSGAPSAVSLATAKSPDPTALVPPSITIFPSGWTATALATSVPPKLTNAFPVVAGANDVSTLPSVLRRVATMSLFGPPWPTATILPSGASATPFALSTPPKSTVCLPSPEKLVSGVPSALSRTIAKSPPPTLVEPTRTNLPSG